MTTINSNLPIEVALAAAYQSVEDGATRDLRAVLAQVQTNNDKKRELRKLQSAFELMKTKAQAAVNNAPNTADGPWKAASAVIREFRDKLKEEFGFDATHPLVELFTGQDVRRRPALEQPKGTPQDDVKKTVRENLDDYLKRFSTLLDGEVQNYSDIGQELQFKLTAANDVYSRMVKARSDVLAKMDRTLNALISNIKG